MTTAIVVPTCRPDSIENFINAWREEIIKNDASLLVVYDRINKEDPRVDFIEYLEEGYEATTIYTLRNIPKRFRSIFCVKTAAVRNLGFYAAHKAGADIIISLDDDVLPTGTSISAHTALLQSTQWNDIQNTHTSIRMRGLPYRHPARMVVLSHGVWTNIPDQDGLSQLLSPEIVSGGFVQGAVPKGSFFPVSAMNMAFRKELIPYIYQAPTGETISGKRIGYDRFDDIWAGLVAKKNIDDNNWTAVIGYSSVIHNRASNVWKNIIKESTGLELNEAFWENDLDEALRIDSDYIHLFDRNIELWRELCQK